MSSYTGTADQPDRAKAITAVIAVHAGLAAIILTGLNVRVVSQVVEQLKTFDIRLPPPPPPQPPPPTPRQHQAKREAGAPAKKAEATPVVAPRPRLPVQSPIPAAPTAGQGSASSSGAAASGTGTGAGGSGNGPGGGGDYRDLTGGRMPEGAAIVALRVEPSGLASNCRVIRSSGDSSVDAGLCPLIVARLRFRPALNDQGQPISYQLQYVATWRL